MRYLVLANGQNSGTVQNSGTGQNKKAGESGWFSKWTEATGIPKATAMRLWQQFADATGLTITPSKATEAVKAHGGDRKSDQGATSENSTLKRGSTSARYRIAEEAKATEAVKAHRRPKKEENKPDIP